MKGNSQQQPKQEPGAGTETETMERHCLLEPAF